MTVSWSKEIFLTEFNSRTSTAWEIIVVDETNSTMEDARNQIATGLRGPVCVVAREQHGGKGQQGRIWQSRPGGLYVTYIFPVGEGRSLIGFSLATGVAIGETLSRIGIEIELKWPNDLYSKEGKKLGGILTEVIPLSGQQALLIGIGINITNEVDQSFATSLNLLGASELEVPPLCGQIGARLEGALSEFVKSGLESSISLWQKRDYLKNKIITISTGSEEIRGKVIGISSQGALLIDEKSGRREIWSGHILNVEL